MLFHAVGKNICCKAYSQQIAFQHITTFGLCVLIHCMYMSNIAISRAFNWMCQSFYHSNEFKNDIYEKIDMQNGRDTKSKKPINFSQNSLFLIVCPQSRRRQGGIKCGNRGTGFLDSEGSHR